MSDKKWEMPEWMEKYTPLISAGGHSVEALMNNKSANFVNNIPLTSIIVCVEGQVAILEKLHRDGIIS